MDKNTIIDSVNNHDFGLFDELVQLIETGKRQLIHQVNHSVIMTFWYVGIKINEHLLNNQRADYGKQIVVTLARQLEERFGRNFEEKNLWRILQFAGQFNDQEIVVPLARHLSWSHFILLLPLKTMEEKLFYAQLAINENWGKRELRKQISNKAYERIQIANTQLSRNAPGMMNVFKDPYLLDFLELKRGYLEKDIEDAIIHDLELFILELGKGFAFVERQKRMIIDGEDYKLDLLFYHRKLKRLVAIDLKIGKFHAKDKGQMELYLKWLNRNEKQDGEESPIGLILCASAGREQVELLEMHKDGIMVAEYWTELPSKNMLEQKLQQSLNEAKERFETRRILGRSESE